MSSAPPKDDLTRALDPCDMTEDNFIRRLFPAEGTSSNGKDIWSQDPCLVKTASIVGPSPIRNVASHPIKNPPRFAFSTVEARGKTSFQLLLTILFSSRSNVMLPFIPVGIVLHFLNVSAISVFIINFLAIIPLSGV
jgi:hypothetical protein